MYEGTDLLRRRLRLVAREPRTGALALGVNVEPTTTFTSKRRLGVDAPLHPPKVGDLTHVLALLYEDVSEHLRDGVLCAALG